MSATSAPKSAGVSTTDDRPQFEPVSAQEADLLLAEAARNNVPTMIWTKNQEEVIRTEILSFDPAQKLLVPKRAKGFDPKRFDDHLAQLGIADCFFSVALGRASLFFRTRYLGTNDTGMRFRAPEKMFKVQRRKDLRYRLPMTSNIRVETPAPYKLIDISASGLSFAIDMKAGTDVVPFEKGDQISEIRFKLDEQTFSCVAEVKTVRALSKPVPGETHHVGIAFVGLQAGKSQLIAGYIFDETRRLFSKLT